MADSVSSDIPRPRPHLLLGNAPDIDPEAPIQSMVRLAREYGPIFRIETFGNELIIVSSQELVNELCDESRFDKRVHGVLLEQREGAGDGLFTAHTQEPNWGLAHRILTPGFSPVWMRKLFPSMWDIAEQLLLKWERLGEGQRIDLSDHMTRLTLDTIALCAFNYRFNSFYEKELHPYVGAMVRSLKEAGARANRPAMMTRLMIRKARQRAEDIRLMHHTADELIAARKKADHPEAFNDLLGLMLTGKDPKTGLGLSDANIRCQMITFLTAGHETTSGLLTFAFYLLLEHPDIMSKAREEAVEVLGNENPRYEHLAQLRYIDRVLKETLRLWPTAPAFAVYPHEKETTIGGRYKVRNDQVIFVLLPMLHRDPAVWADPERFNPDRFLPEEFEKLPPNCWKPFGNGQRACIGRPFALQEATIAMASILQRFEVFRADPHYELHVKETLTLKPEGFFITAKRRQAEIVPGAGSTSTSQSISISQTQPRNDLQLSERIPLNVLFGSNSGSCEAFAQRIATDANAQGYAASIGTLDSAVGTLPREGATIIVTASYEGHPTDNAKAFVAWLEQLSANALTGVKYAVFGCGNRDWVHTYQKVPKRIDEKLLESGAVRLMERGEADARADFFGDFDRWYAPFWDKLGTVFGQETRESDPVPQLELEFVEAVREPLLRQNDLERGEVVENLELVNAPGRAKHHIEIALPVGARYRAGDYLAVLPSNSPESVGRVLRRFGLAYDTQIVIHSCPGVQTSFPTGQPVLAGELLSSFVELGLTATRQQIEKLSVSTTMIEERKVLDAWVNEGDSYVTEILNKRVSVIDLLERFHSCELPFSVLLQILPPLKPRRYSISSSPKWSEQHCTITVAILEAPAWSGQGTFRGVASNYLACARPGTKIAVTTRPSQAAFHLPDSLQVPIIMVAAGTGIAPFRGFLQERAIRLLDEGAAGTTLLFFGCRNVNEDFLYQDELLQWEQLGVVSVRTAFSAAPDGDVKYVQHRLWKDRAEVMNLINAGARIYVCGDGRRMAPDVRETFSRIYGEYSGHSVAQVSAWMAELEDSFRYTQDVFA